MLPIKKRKLPGLKLVKPRRWLITRRIALTPYRTRSANLDNYRVVSESSVLFGFNKDVLTKDAKADLDKIASSVSNTKGYIVAVQGNTDSTGDAEYNYELSQRRARAVIQYLASGHQIPAYKIYDIGLGKDKPAESNKTREGRTKNRRVDVRLMTNVADSSAPAATPAPAGCSADQPVVYVTCRSTLLPGGFATGRSLTEAACSSCGTHWQTPSAKR